MDHCRVTVQPAGPVGKRHVLLTLVFEEEDDNARQIELVRAANRLGQALISGSVGLVQEFNLSNGRG